MQGFARNRHLQELVAENDELRRRVGRQGEVETYVESLVLKLEELRGREGDLASECGRLRGECARLEDLLREKEGSYREEMRYVFQQHERLLNEREGELGSVRGAVDQQKRVIVDLERELEGVSMRWRKAEDEWRVERESLAVQRRGLVGEIEELGRVVSRMKEDNLMMVEYSKEVEGRLARSEAAVVAAEEDNRQVLLRLREQLVQQQEQFKHDNQHLKQQLLVSQDENQRILQKMQLEQQQHLQLADQLSKQLAVQQQDQQRVQLKMQEQLTLLGDELTRAQHGRAEAERSSQIVARELQELKRLQAHLVAENDGVKLEQQRAVAVLAQSEKDCATLRSRLSQLQLSVDKERDLVAVERRQLKEQLGASKRKYDQLQRVHLKRVGEYKEAMTANSNLQTLTNKQEVHIKTLNREKDELSEDLKGLKEKNAKAEAEKKELLEKVEVEELDRRTLKDLNSKLQDTLQQLEVKFTSLTGEGRDKGLDEQFLKQMHSMLDNFHLEREEQNRRHALEKEKMREVYEFSLKEREVELMRQVASLQEQLHLSRRFDGLVERNRHAYALSPHRPL